MTAPASNVSAPPPLILDRRLDIIGDVHGCLEELHALLEKLGWRDDGAGAYEHPEDRVLVCVGDLINRGPHSVESMALIMHMRDLGRAVTVLGNHDMVLMRWLRDRTTPIRAFVRDTVTTLEAKANEGSGPPLDKVMGWLDATPLFARFEYTDKPEQALIVVHASWHPALEPADGALLDATCVYGPTTQIREGGAQHRTDWRPFYPEGAPFLIHGHTAFIGPLKEVNRTLCIDTGCVFGGALTGIKWPERETSQVQARSTYARYPNIPGAPPLLSIDTLPNGLDAMSWPWNPDGQSSPLAY